MAEIIFKDKLRLTKQTFDELTLLLANSNLDTNSREMLEICKTRNFLADILKLDRQLKKAESELASDRKIIANPGEDPEIKELAIAEIEELETQITRLTNQINILLLPRDSYDERNIFLEIIADNDLNKSGFSVNDLARMYGLYSETQNWKVKFVSESVDDSGDLKEVILAIEGDGVYGKLKSETGVHQLEAVETNSTDFLAIVKVMPQLGIEEVEIEPQEIKIYDRRSTNCRCHLCVCKTEFGIQILHQPTGIRITCAEERSQLQNRERAMQILRAKLYEINLAKQQKEVRGLRLSQVGTKARSEKIRTYNYKNNCITDHRLGKNFPLANSLEGDIGGIIQSYISQDQQNRLEQLASSPDTAEALN